MHAPVEALKPSRAILIADTIALALVTVAASIAGRSTGLMIFKALALVASWSALVAMVSAVPPLPWRLRPVILLAALLVILRWPVRAYFSSPLPGASVTDDRLRLITVVFAVLAFLLYFLASYTSHARRLNPHPLLDALIPHARLLAATLAITVAILMVHLYAQRNWMNEAQKVFVVITLVLVAEAALHLIARLYQPRRLRGPINLGRSILLPAFFGEAGPIQSVSATFQKTFGVTLSETWLAQLGRRFAAPLVLVGLIAIWLSTGVTRIPVDSRGVLVVGSKLYPQALRPGLHLHAPWPLGRVAIVPTERVQEMAIGFERDLLGPILWAEKHFEGEQNLLVGQGEELLTINVPIHYRIKDAVAYFQHTQSAAPALDALGYRELLALADRHTSFGLMTTDREEISSKLRASLQQACDQLGLGLEITFVGLKDIHPPVAVAPAYQDVVSAEEQKVTQLDSARTYAVETNASARVIALQTRQSADSSALQRVSRAQGETSRFLAPLATWRSQSDLLRTRLRLEALEDALGGVRQLYLVPPASTQRTTLLPGPNVPLVPR